MKMKDENLAWQHISTETILHDRWMDMRKSEYRLPDGKTAGPFYTFSRKDYAVIRRETTSWSASTARVSGRSRTSSRPAESRAA